MFSAMNAENRVITVGVGALSIDDVVAVARHGAKVELDPAALDEIARTRARVCLLYTSDAADE